MEKIILASQSPRRKQLLEWAEIPFDILVKETAETYPPELPVEEVPVFIAREKARVIADTLQTGQLVLAADTVVVLNNEIIGKPKDRMDAVQILTKLAGQTHAVITGVVMRKEDKEWAFADRTLVRFHPLTSEQIQYYVDHYKPYDKAGAYAIQEWIGVIGIHSIEGDFYNVMGLPVSRVIQTLQNQVF